MGAVQRWFVRNRGLASGIASSGIGVGTLVRAAARVILDRHGRMARGLSHPRRACGDRRHRQWRFSSRTIRAIADSAPTAATRSRTTQAAQPAGASIADAIKSRRFVGLYAACLACSFGVFVPFVHLAPYAIDHGIAASSAVLLVSVIGVGSTVGRFFLGGLADRMGRELALLAMFVGMALALIIWAVSTTFWPLAVFAFVFGVGYGGWVALLAVRRHGLFRRPQCQRHHRRSLHQRRNRHADRPERGRVRFRYQPQLHAADHRQRLRQRDCCRHHGTHVTAFDHCRARAKYRPRTAMPDRPALSPFSALPF